MGLFGGRKDEEGATRGSTGEQAAPSAAPSQKVNPTGGGGASAGSDARAAAAGSTGSGRQATKESGSAPQSGGDDVANIGKSIVFKGDLTGDEDLIIDGNVEGRVHLPAHQLTIGAHGRVKAELQAKSVIIVGQIEGDVNATERVEVQASGVVDGDIRSPRLLIQEGAVVNGAIEMGKSGASAASTPKAEATSPAATPGAEQARKSA